MNGTKFMLRAALLSLVFLASSTKSWAEGVALDANASGGVGKGFLMTGHLFFFSDNSALGNDVLKDGSSIYTRFDAQYNWTDYFTGLGFFYEQDKFGKEQKDAVMGVVVEVVLGSFFTKIMPGFVNQEYVNRSFSKRSGSFLGIELGIRGELFQKTLFYEVALQRRTEKVTQEDARVMADPFQKTETMPVLGMGISI